MAFRAESSPSAHRFARVGRIPHRILQAISHCNHSHLPADVRIATHGLDLPEGKVKFDDPVVRDLTAHFEPKKVTPYYFELLPEAYEEAEIIAIERHHILEVLILDHDKVEVRLERAGDELERAMLERILTNLEGEVPVCDQSFSSAERPLVRSLGPLSLKPTVVFDGAGVDLQDLFVRSLEKAGRTFFYTAGKQEVHAWLVPRNSDAQTCAGRIHSDLARGFVKAEIVSVEDLLASHSMADARKKGLTRLVDREFVIPENTVIDVRFNV